LLWGAVAVVCVGAVGLSIASDDILAELSSANTVEKLSHSKIEMWPMIGQSAWAFARGGMGRGAFESAFTRFQTRSVEQTFTHPENAVLQLACEFGLPATAALLALFGLGYVKAARRRLRSEPSALDLALLAGAAGLLLHNLVDFNLEFSACAVALWVALGIVARPDPDEPQTRWALEFSSRPAVVTAGVLALLALGAVRAGRATLAGDERMLAEGVKPGIPAETVEAAALPAVDRHPADYLLYEMVARAYVSERPYRPREALAFLNRALFLRPIDAEAHRIAAHALLSLGKRSQGFLEFRLALEAAHPSGQWSILSDAVSRARTADEICACVPDDPEWIAHAADQAAGRGLRQTAQECLEQALALHGESPASVPLLLSLGRLQAADGDPTGALERIAAAHRVDPGNVSTAVLEAQVLGAAGRTGEAVAALEPLVSTHPASLELALALGRAHLLAGETRKAVDSLERVRPFVTGNDTRALLLVTEAEAYAHDGRLPQQLEAYRAAARLQPRASGHHYNAAHVLEALGRSGEALDEIHAGLRLDAPQAAQALQPWMQALAQKKKDTEDAMRQRTLLLQP
jgi:tetratricopeptide (TPR) repeat protein